MRKKIHKIFKKGSYVLDRISRIIYSEKPNPSNLKWHANPENEWKRYEYDLNQDSLVVEVGGYKGQWTTEIFAMHQPNIIVFEPVPHQYELIKRKVQNNPKIKVYPYGLWNSNVSLKLAIHGDHSSLFQKYDESKLLPFIKASEFFSDTKEIDLMSLNCEGSEYDLIDHFIDSGLIHKIKNLQIQFHDFVPNAQKRMKTAREKISRTHVPTYAYDFVWDNWERKTNNSKQI